MDHTLFITTRRLLFERACMNSHHSHPILMQTDPEVSPCSRPPETYISSLKEKG